MLTKAKIFLFLALSFVGGVFVRSVFGVDIILIWLTIVLAITVGSVWYKNKKTVVIFGMLLFFLCGIWRTGFRLAELNNLEKNIGEIKTKVVIVKEPEKKEKYQQIIVREKERIGKILLRAGLYENLKYGDELDLKCQLELPKNFSNDFDYRMYLAKNRIYYLCQKMEIRKTGNNYGNRVYSAIIDFKNKSERHLNQIIPQPEAALANGLLFGGDNRLSQKIKDAFSKTGMTHIVAVSGYNVTIIANYLILLGIFLGLWRPQAFWFAVVGVFLFVAMIGFPASAIRAGVMGTILLWAMKNGRLANSQNAIIFAGAIMLLINPLLLRYDVGFQLSFLATLGIVELSPFWEQYFVRKFRAMGLTEIFFMTVSAQIFVLPIIIYNFHTFSWMSVFANLLILLIIPFTMLLVFLTIIFGFIFQPLALAFGWLAYFPLAYEIKVVDIFSRIEWASQEINNFNFWFGVGWYIVLFGVIAIIREKLRKRKMKNLL